MYIEKDKKIIPEIEFDDQDYFYVMQQLGLIYNDLREPIKEMKIKTDG